MIQRPAGTSESETQIDDWVVRWSPALENYFLIPVTFSLLRHPKRSMRCSKRRAL